jgi:valyl-tRNA synthetase
VTRASQGVGVPEKPSLVGLEERWAKVWAETGIYAFDATASRDEVYAIDTPPPTVSGSLHIGHVFSYTHTDIVARYQRMRGRTVFYPMGWDDNGLPTERRVENYYGIRCDPSQPYEPDFTPPDAPAARPVPVSRRNFVELCLQLTGEDERAFEDLWRRLGLSVDWSRTYTTIGPRAQRVSQHFFLRMLERGEVYRVDAPTLWDVSFQTAVAQAEVEDREVSGLSVRLAFALDDGATVHVETTRPELLPACVALVADPGDDRYSSLFGQHVTTPLFGARVPVHAHPAADAAKGTGLVMVCTFGDLNDVTWWREFGLPVKSVLRPDGRMAAVDFSAPALSGPHAADAQATYANLEGKTAEDARRRIVELLRDDGALVGAPASIKHHVKFYEKGTKPLEIITSRQWFVHTKRMQQRLLERGRELHWHPQNMRNRYEDWVRGLTGDWCISRQRFFGVPFPLWYEIDAHGAVRNDKPLLPRADALPIDPSSDVPDGYREEQRGQPGGFVGDPDVMDTWATSSLSPQIAAGWGDADDDLSALVTPMDLRPQAHEIIRTWLFATVVRSELELGELPWRHVAISGWVLDPDRKKMSKSKGNAMTPTGLLEEYGSDAARYWAAKGRPGVDTAFDLNQLRVGRRLATKILNAARFAYGDDLREPDRQAVTAPLDRALLAHLRRTIEAATAALEDYEYTSALERIESDFWTFTDQYIELVKGRRYADEGEGAASANATLALAADIYIRLFAPFLAFTTEEVWSWRHDDSVHTTSWPTPDELALPTSEDEPAGLLDLAARVLGEIRKAKSAAQVPMRTDVASVSVAAPAEQIEALDTITEDLRNAGRVCVLRFARAKDLAVDVRLAESP